MCLESHPNLRPRRRKHEQHGGAQLDAGCHVGREFQRQQRDVVLVGEQRAGRGPVTTAQLARTLERYYKNVQADAAALSEWLVVQRDEDGRVCVPWAEGTVDMKQPARLAA